jgi:hypothetical protein
MADWKQITARIRRARGSKDPAGQLTNLFQKTRDAMVAFELARHFEAAGKNQEAVAWYNTAAQRFRRSAWKTKAIDAITRLGGEISAAAPSLSAPSESLTAAPSEEIFEPSFSAEPAQISESEVAVPDEQLRGSAEGDSGSAPVPGLGRRRRRGHRGGKNRRKRGSSAAAQQPSAARAGIPSAESRSARPPALEQPEHIAPSRVADSRSFPQFPLEPAAEAAPSTSSLKGRFGDPGLSSRLSLLEMQFRRLLTCPSVRLDEADRAPAGPGVFVLTDKELSTYYYVEACDTLRIAIANVARGGVGRRGAPSIKPLLAEHLGIPDSRVSKYLSDHCVVRWLQLDEGASHFAHFAISILRPILNE